MLSTSSLESRKWFRAWSGGLSRGLTRRGAQGFCRISHWQKIITINTAGARESNGDNWEFRYFRPFAATAWPLRAERHYLGLEEGARQCRDV